MRGSGQKGHPSSLKVREDSPHVAGDSNRQVSLTSLKAITPDPKAAIKTEPGSSGAQSSKKPPVDRSSKPPSQTSLHQASTQPFKKSPNKYNAGAKTKKTSPDSNNSSKGGGGSAVKRELDDGYVSSSLSQRDLFSSGTFNGTCVSIFLGVSLTGAPVCTHYIDNTSDYLQQGFIT